MSEDWGNQLCIFVGLRTRALSELTVLRTSSLCKSDSNESRSCPISISYQCGIYTSIFYTEETIHF